MKTYQNNQLEVNPSGVVLVVERHFPGAIPGLLEDDTSGVSNPDITPGFPVALAPPKVTKMAIEQPAWRAGHPIAPVLPGVKDNSRILIIYRCEGNPEKARTVSCFLERKRQCAIGEKQERLSFPDSFSLVTFFWRSKRK